MVNTQLLDERIDKSGLRIGYLVDQIGITRQAFDLKKKNERKFKVAEIYVICDLLKINNDQDKNAIFFADSVEL